MSSASFTKTLVQVCSGFLQDVGHSYTPDNFNFVGVPFPDLVGQEGRSMLLEAGLQLLQSAGDYVRVLSSHSVPIRDVQKVTDAKSDACAHTFARPKSHGSMRAVNIDGKDVVHCLFLAKQEHMSHGVPSHFPSWTDNCNNKVPHSPSV